MQTCQLKTILEALIFAAEEPIGLVALTGLVEDLRAGRAEVQEAIDQLLLDYQEEAGRGIFLREVAGGFQFATRLGVAPWVAKLNAAKPKSLSQAGLETLAIIAYRQPMVRSEVEAIRGVDSGGVLKTLLERGLLKILGRREEAGQPLVYGTTTAFLELFHLNSLEELPSMREIEQLTQTQKAEGLAENASDGESVPKENPESQLQEETLEVVSEVVTQEDNEALVELEESLKDLRKLEKEFFPKEEPAVAEGESSIKTEEPHIKE